jgi:Alpha/beta hydrolase family
MSLTTESSLQRERAADFGLFSRWICPLFCPCLPQRRRVGPTNPVPDNSDFMTFGKKGGRIIYVLHYEPQFNDLLLRRRSFAVRLKKIAQETNQDDCDSVSSSDEYWFTKWTVPLRTVKKFQLENLRKQSRSSTSTEQNQSCDTTLPSTQPVFTISTFAKDQSAQIIKQASQEAAAKINQPPDECKVDSPVVQPTLGGIVNPSFEASPTDPGASIATRPPVSTYIHSKPALFFIHGAGESSESWRQISQYFACLHYEVVAIDLLGHGFSSTPNKVKAYTFRKLLGDVLRVFDEYIFNGKKAVVIGHGYG